MAGNKNDYFFRLFQRRSRPIHYFFFLVQIFREAERERESEGRQKHYMSLNYKSVQKCWQAATVFFFRPNPPFNVVHTVKFTLESSNQNRSTMHVLVDGHAMPRMPNNQIGTAPCPASSWFISLQPNGVHSRPEQRATRMKKKNKNKSESLEMEINPKYSDTILLAMPSFLHEVIIRLRLWMALVCCLFFASFSFSTTMPRRFLLACLRFFLLFYFYSVVCYTFRPFVPPWSANGL